LALIPRIGLRGLEQTLLEKAYRYRKFCSHPMLKAFQVRVYGRVQRVGYRRFVLDSAQELGLSGHVKNEKDGSVTVFAQGDEAILEKFIEMLKSPPPPAYVKSIDVREAKPRQAMKYFTIRPSPLHEELQEGFGAMQSIFMEYWREFREFARRTDENFKIMMEKYGEISEKLTTILETLTRESRETREMLNETMKLLKEALEKLSR
jgi:acylphosphatase